MVPDTLDANPALSASRRSLTPVYWGGVALAALSGAIHLWLGITEGKLPLIVAGSGFGIGIAAVVLDVRRTQIVKLGVPFTAGQIILYGIAHAAELPALAPIELVDKVAQTILVGVLVVLLHRA